MARHTFVALTSAVPGREAEFDHWYDGQHLADVAKIPGVVSAKRFRMDWQEATGFQAPPWRSLAIYEIEADDPQVTLNTIRAASGTDLMPLSDALTQTGMLQLLAHPAETAAEPT